MMKKDILLIFMLLAISRCSPRQQVLDGKYTYHPLGYSLTLSSDHTFQYEEFMGWARERVLVLGAWESQEKELRLNSKDSIMQNVLPLNARELAIPEQDSLKFFLHIPQIEGDYVGWVLVLNNVPYPFVNDSIVSVINMDELIQFYLIAERNRCVRPLLNREIIQTRTYTLQNSNSNFVELSIPLTGKEIYRYASYELLDDTLMVKKKQLVWARKNIVLKYSKQ